MKVHDLTLDEVVETENEHALRLRRLSAVLDSRKCCERMSTEQYDLLKAHREVARHYANSIREVMNFLLKEEANYGS
jgi:hypothetical protein